MVDSAFADYFAEYRRILPAERVLCVYGAARNDSVWVNFVKPAIMHKRTESSAQYDACPRPKSPSDIARYLGTWHSHRLTAYPDEPLCSFSEPDSHSFYTDTHAIMELLSCGSDRLLARSKK